MKTYRALEKGFDGDKIRDPGEVFTADIPKGSWMEELDAKGNAVENKADPLDHDGDGRKGGSKPRGGGAET